MSRNRNGLSLLFGISIVLRGIERLLRTRAWRPKVSGTYLADGQSAVVVSSPVASAGRANYFTIRRTGSEVGMAYWVLQGAGCFESFTLFDSWREAMDEADSRIMAGRLTDSHISALKPTSEDASVPLKS